MRRVVLLMAACVLTACKPAYETKLSTRQVMNQVITPAWDAYRNSSGYVDSATGSRDLTPTTEEGWRAADNAAASLAETGNLLLLPGRSKGGDWNKAASEMSRVALEARAAVEARDSKRMFDIGGQLYQACTDCHQEYQLPLLDKTHS